jgi:glycosyltransferase involved in cell wall biosynthesis
MIAVSFIIPTFGRGPILIETLKHLRAAAEGLSAEIIVVDDSKTSAVDVRSSDVKVVANPGSGAASARNFGARQASGELLVFVDDDVLVSRQNLARTLTLHEQHKEACINLNWKYSEEMMNRLEQTPFGRFLRRVGLTDYRGCVPDLPWRDGGTFEVPKVTALYFFVAKRVFDALGGFDESFRNQSVEDDEFSQRVRESGHRMFLDASEFVLHNEYDRIDLVPRLNRLKTGAYNKRQAFEMGMNEYELLYSPVKVGLYSVLSAMKPVLLGLARRLPNSVWFDRPYGVLAHILIGTVIFDGHYRRDQRPLVDRD